LYINTPAPGLETTVGETEEAENPFDVGFAGDGKTLKPGATYGSGKFEVVPPVDVQAQEAGVLKENLVPIAQALELNPAQKAARRMEKLIHDQIEESNGASEIRNALFEAALFGTGIIKGPFNFNKTLHRWEDAEGERQYTPVDVRVPRIEFVSIWDFFSRPKRYQLIRM